MNEREISESDGRQRLTTSISWRPDDLEQAKKAAKSKGLSLSAWVRLLILDELNQKKVIKHINRNHTDEEYREAALELMARDFGHSSGIELQKKIDPEFLSQHIVQYVAKARGMAFTEVANILKKYRGIAIKPGEDPNAMFDDVDGDDALEERA